MKSRVGRASRGLTVRQLRDGLRTCGLAAEAVYYDKQKPEAFPCPGVVLLDRGHYVVVADAAGEEFEIFDPGLGWSWVSHTRLARLVNGLGIQVEMPSRHLERRSPPRENRRSNISGRGIIDLFPRRLTAATIAVATLSQLVVLCLPFLSMQSVDSFASSSGLSGVSQVGLAFIALSALTAIVSLAGNLIGTATTRIAMRAYGRALYDRLAAQSPAWFDRHSPTTVQNRINSAEFQFSFYVDLARTIGALIASFVVGIVALGVISPWLAFPGLCSLVLATGIELAFNKATLFDVRASLEASQRKAAFVLDTLSQMPLLHRFNSVRAARARYRTILGQYTAAESRLQNLRTWESLSTTVIKSCEILVFVSIAAYFMKQGDYTLGAFVALGAYKDLFAQSMASLFQLRQRHKALEVHRLQLTDLANDDGMPKGARGSVKAGHLCAQHVRFSYGSLEPDTLQDVSFEIAPGHVTVINGPSGSGKSTLAKILLGILTPTSGEVTIDGQPPLLGMESYGSVLQSDRLINATIRENVTLLRPGVSDDDIWEALRIAELAEFVRCLPMRLNTMVGDNVGGLSGGQRQRVLIARAVLKRPTLLLLDEATSSLEVETESRILKNLIEMSSTLVLIAHRPEVLAIAGTIVTITGGRSSTRHSTPAAMALRKTESVSG